VKTKLAVPAVPAFDIGNSAAASGVNIPVIDGNNSAQHVSVPITAPGAPVIGPPFNPVPGSSLIVLDEEGNQQVIYVASETTAPTALGKCIHGYVTHFARSLAFPFRMVINPLLSFIHSYSFNLPYFIIPPVQNASFYVSLVAIL
jgi:hypothetical protein